MVIEGKIQIDPESKTVSIQLENGSHCLQHYPQGVFNFLTDEIEFINKNFSKQKIG
ncbi:hypothetical protein [Fictibacillus sp. NRS-1165]|uniref:hypothetical protein n=1 Tax=Fictibacillus sp. NRS-1165 TaxID=3144463 RepID=UPI003D26054A